MARKATGTEPRTRRPRRGSLTPYLLLAPALLLLAGFRFYPLFHGFALSTQRYNLSDPSNRGFVGLENFEAVIHDGTFWLCLLNSLIWVCGSVGLQFVAGFALALLLNRQFRGRGFIRSVAFSPWAVAGVVVALLWGWMFHGQAGVVNDLLLKTHLSRKPVGWLANPATAFPAVIIANVWSGMPFFAVTLLAALQTIPDELYEAASMDGAGRLARLRHITIPIIADIIILTTLLRAIWTFNQVDLIYAMTRGGPVDSTRTLAVYIFTTFFPAGRLGYGSALAVFLFFFLVVFALLYVRISGFGRRVEA